MHHDVSLFDLRLRRRMLLGFTVGTALYTLVIVALYPQFKDAASLDFRVPLHMGLPPT